MGTDMGVSQGMGGDGSDFLNLELLGADDLQMDGSGIAVGENDGISNIDQQNAGMKRSLSQTQQQMAAAANANALKRSKVGTAPSNRGPSPRSPQSGTSALQTSDQNSSGSSKTPPAMGSVNAK